MYNSDFADKVGDYSLEATLKLENAFLGLCNYDMFVSSETYVKYFFELQRLGKQNLNKAIEVHNSNELKEELLKYSMIAPNK